MVAVERRSNIQWETRAMRRLIGVVLMLTMLAAVGGCRNSYMQGGTGSNGGGSGSLHTGIPF